MFLQSKHLRTRFILSSLLVLIPVIIFTTIVYYYNQNLNRKTADTNMAESLSRAVKNIDSLLAHIDSLIAQSYDLRQFCVQSDEGRTYDANRLAAELNYMKKGFYYDVKPFCFCGRYNCVYTISGAMPYSAFEQNEMIGWSLSKSYFFTALLSITKPTLLYVKNDIGDVGNIAYMQPLRSSFDASERHVIVLFISEDVFFQEIIEYIGNLPGDLYMYSSVTNMIVEKNLNNSVALPKQKIFQLKGIGTIHSEPGFVVFREKSEKHGITYVLSVEANSFYAGINTESTSLFVMSVIFFISCILLLILISRHNYKPILSLAVDIAGDSVCVDEEDALNFIRDKYDQTVMEKLSLHVRLDEQLKIIHNQLCVRLLSGQIKSEIELEHISQCIGFPFNCSYCAVLYIWLPNKEAQKKLVDYLSDFISVKKGWLIGEPLREEGLCIIVTFNSVQDKSPTDTLHSIAEDLYRNLLDRNGLQNQHFLIGVGKWKNSLLSLNDSYLESLAVLHNNSDKAESGYYSYEQESFDDLGHGENWTTLLALLWETIVRGETSVVCNTFNEIIEHIRFCSKPIQLLRYSELLTILDKCASQVNICIDLQKFSLMLLNDSFDLFTESVFSFIVEMCDGISDSLTQRDAAIRITLLNYIVNHCFEGDFSLTCVTDALHLSKVKVNTILQEEVGMTFSSYLSHLRFDRFCDQLLHTDKSIQTIVKEIGYYDVSSFLRKFKSIKGMTAGQYRIKWRG